MQIFCLVGCVVEEAHRCLDIRQMPGVHQEWQYQVVFIYQDLAMEKDAQKASNSSASDQVKHDEFDPGSE